VWFQDETYRSSSQRTLSVQGKDFQSNLEGWRLILEILFKKKMIVFRCKSRDSFHTITSQFYLLGTQSTITLFEYFRR